MAKSGTSYPLAQFFAERPRLLPVCAYLLVLFAGLAAYSNTLHCSFNFDDTPALLENPAVKNFSVFTPRYLLTNGRPVTDFTFALNHYFHGFSVAGFHLVNLAIHLLAGCLVFSLITTTFRTPWCARVGAATEERMGLQDAGRLVGFLTALLFVVHPVQTQAVTYIVQRSTSLATLLYLATVVLYARARLLGLEKSPRRHLSPGLYLLALLTGLLAFKAKQIAFTLPLALLLYDLFFFPVPLRRRLGVVFFSAIPVVGAATALLVRGGGSLDLLDRATRENPLVSRPDYLLTQFRVVVTYLRLLVLPVNQHLDYDYPVYHTFFSVPVALSFLLLLSLALGGVVLLRRSGKNMRHGTTRILFRLAAFGIFWFFLTLAVESSVIPISDVIVEHRLYLPAFGALLAAVSSLFTIAGDLPGFGGRSRLVSGALVVVAIVLAMACHGRNRVWATDATLWNDEVAKSPTLSRPLNNRARVYLQQNEPLKALADLVKANELAPGYADTWLNICVALNRLGSYGDRFRCGNGMFDAYGTVYSQFQREWFTLASNNLGLAYSVLGDHSKALYHLRETIRLAPAMAEAHVNLGLELLATGDRWGALAEWQTVAELNPDLARKMLLWFGARDGGGR